jgi:predicted Zn-dependent protease with MMP-like domain
MKRNQFERLVIEAVSSLPLRVREAMENVAIVIEPEHHHPSSFKLRQGGRKSNAIGIKRDEVLLGLYEGIPLIRRSSGYFGVLPDKITIFQKPIEALSNERRQNVATLVREVVWHEIGHHFGLTDAELRILEKKRRQQKRSRESA